MAGEYDSSEFIDTDFLSQKSSPGHGSTSLSRSPAHDDVNRKVIEAQQKLVELKRAQEELERERAGLEDLRRRQTEFQTGRQEMLQQLTRALGLLEEAEFAARRDCEQMAKTAVDFREALAKIQSVQDQSWNKENIQIELTRALTILENARMEWNAARLKLPVLAGEAKSGLMAATPAPAPVSPANSLAEMPLIQLCKIGLAMTWPMLLAALLALGVFTLILIRK